MNVISDEIYWKILNDIRVNDELTLDERVASMIHVVALKSNYCISEVELEGLLKYLNINTKQVKSLLQRIFGSGMLILLFPTGKVIDPDSEFYRERFSEEICDQFKQDVEQVKREML